MVDVELGGCERIRLTDDRYGSGFCQISWSSIPAGRHRVILTLIGDDGRWDIDAEISIGQVGRVVQGVTDGGEVELDDRKRWVVTEFEEERQGFRCLICDDDWYEGETVATKAGTDAGTYAEFPDRHLGFVHEGCKDDFAKALEEVWDCGELLSERI